MNQAVVVHTFNHSTSVAEVGRSLSGSTGQTGLQMEFQGSQKYVRDPISKKQQKTNM